MIGGFNSFLSLSYCIGVDLGVCFPDQDRTTISISIIYITSIFISSISMPLYIETIKHKSTSH